MAMNVQPTNNKSSPPGAAMTSPVNLEWAKSLVGRDWEIFWEEEAENEEDENIEDKQMERAEDSTTAAAEKPPAMMAQQQQQQQPPVMMVQQPPAMMLQQPPPSAMMIQQPPPSGMMMPQAPYYAVPPMQYNPMQHVNPYHMQPVPMQQQQVHSLPRQWWNCGVCRRAFPDYGEARRHEEQCRRQREQAAAAQQQPPRNQPPQQQQQQLGGASNSVQVAVTNAAPKMNESEEQKQSAVGAKTDNESEEQKRDDNKRKGGDEDEEMKDANDDEYNESEEEEADVTDWYDATVIGFNPETEVFQVRFVGDDSVYTMKLKPSIVRPCIRAWAKRSKAILEGDSSGETFDFGAWEKQLPKDTAKLEDREYLDQQWKRAQSLLSGTGTAPATGGSRDALAKDRQDIVRLCFLVQSQIYLRSKLAPVVFSGSGETGVAAMSDAYLDHLVKCLKELQELCVWYEDCSALYDNVIRTASGVTNRPSEASGDQQGRAIPMYAPDSSLFNIEYMRGYCLENGRAMINSLLAMDFSRAGAKRRPVVVVPSAPSVRKTKRRKGYKATGFLEARENQDEDILLLEEGEFMSLKSVKKFVGKVHREKWYVGPLLRMLERLCSDVQEPVRLWKRNVDIILMEECDPEDDDTSSSEDEATLRENPKIEEPDDTSGDEDEKERQFSFEEISSCLDNVKNDRVLAKFDLSHWTNELRGKLSGIEAFEADVWKAIPHIVDEVGQNTKTDDNILSNLREVKEAALSTNMHVKNVHPLGRSSSRLTRTVIDNAIAVREWILDLHHAEHVRERLSFVQEVVSRAPTLPHVPAPPHRLVNESLTSAMTSRLGQAMSRIQSLSSKLYSHVEVFSRYENVVSESDSVQLRSKPDVRAALDELRATPVVSLVEEKLSIRWDVLKWRDSVQAPLDNVARNRLQYDVLAKLKEQLDAIVNGSSPSRSEILNGLEKNPGVESSIRQFARTELDYFCAKEAATIEALYLKAKDWKDRADSVIQALRIHGNPTAGSSISNKSAAMVDLKRIDDLLAEYDGLGSTMEERRTRLRCIQEEAKSWCSDVERIVDDDNNVLERLTVARDTRPKGVLMDPARHVVDSWIEILDWHNRVNSAFRRLASSSASSGHGQDAAAGSSLTAAIADTIYPLMLEGSEVISMFSRQSASGGDISFSPNDALVALSRAHEKVKPARTISVEKFASNRLGKLLLSRIVDRDRDVSQGTPVFCLLLLTWRVAVIGLLERQSVTEAVASDEAKHRPTLEEAKQLRDIQPSFPESIAALPDGTIPFHCLLSRVETPEVAKFRGLISDGERVEAAARALLPTTRDIVRGAFDKTNDVRVHLEKLKELQTDFKSRIQERSGLILSSTLEQSLDSVVKDVAWLERTFKYAALHSDTVPEEQSEDYDMSDRSAASDATQDLVPWDVLVSLHERLPDPNTGPGGAITRVSLRVKELYEAASAWQEEVTSQMSLSFRGGAKRRVPVASTTETDEAPKIDMSKLAQLAKHPILDRVSMPREEAVRRVLGRAREFEESLAGLLNADFEDSLADKTPYPESDSLVGKNGDFLLYRLTGSALFEALNAKLKEMSAIAVDVLADTPGKGAFDWIVKAVAWIEDLKEAVDDAPSGKLAIPMSDAKRLLDRGNDLFLEFSDDLRRTLACHKLSLSTNKATERLTVVIGKGGAMHSLGGTAIKWCPLLLEWLREDVERLRDWERKVVETARAFQVLTSKDTSPTKDRETVYRRIQLQEKVALLLEEGCNSLVIAPLKTILSNLRNLRTKMDELTNKELSACEKSLGIDAKTLIKTRFEDGGPSVEDRYDVLDALLKRRQLDEEVADKKGDKTSEALSSAPGGATPRDKARTVLEQALRKGVEMMGIDDSEKSLFCALKAFEIEQAMFAVFRHELGARAVTKNYIEKLRSLRYNMEDTKNPTLCPRILVGEISAARLVKMTSEEMASQKVRLKKAKAEEESKKNIILNPGAAKSKGGAPAKPKEAPPARHVKGLLKGSPKSSPQTSPANPRSVLKKTPTAASFPLPSSDPTLFAASPSPRQGKPTIKPASLQKLPPPPLDAKTARQQAAASLPTPPSLAVMARTSPLVVAPSVASAAPLRYVQNTNGKDVCSVSVADSTRIFNAKMALVDEADRAQAEEILPELLTEKGRIKIDGFTSFLRGKLDSGRWKAIPMRLMTVSDSSAAEFKKYYKEYEKKARISMFSIGNDSKIFLVTPKFHTAAKPLKFESSTSTYAVMLVRSRQFSD